MKRSPISILQVLITLLIFLGAIPRAQELDFDRTHASFLSRMAALDQHHADKTVTSTGQYINALKHAQATFRKQGDLDAYIMIQKELARVAQFPDEVITPPAKIAGLFQTYRGLRQKADTEYQAEQVKLIATYHGYLTSHIKKLTQAGQMELALSARNKLSELETGYPDEIGAAMTSFSEAAKPFPENSSLNRFVFLWPPRAGSPDPHRANGIGNSWLQLESGGDARIEDGWMDLQGGRITASAAAKTIESECRESNELTLAIRFGSDSLRQSGPARIASFSLDGMHRNFSLCQENDTIVYRLRTTVTGENGTSPEVKICKLAADTEMVLVIAYRAGDLRCWMNGERIKTRHLDGNFENWDDSHGLVFGNEYKEERPWKGTISQVAIYPKALSEEDAVYLSSRFMQD